jgi:hypothetical protein
VKAATFAAIFAALYAGHYVGDLWIQTHRQAISKALPGWAGRWACARHVATLTGAITAALAAVVGVTGVRPDLDAVIIGLAVNAASHYAADRRTPLKALADWLGATLIPGKGEFYQLGTPRPGHDDNPTLGTGAYQLDQAFHTAWLLIAALIITA